MRVPHGFRSSLLLVLGTALGGLFQQANGQGGGKEVPCSQIGDATARRQAGCGASSSSSSSSGGFGVRRRDEDDDDRAARLEGKLQKEQRKGDERRRKAFNAKAAEFMKAQKNGADLGTRMRIAREALAIEDSDILSQFLQEAESYTAAARLSDQAKQAYYAANYDLALQLCRRAAAHPWLKDEMGDWERQLISLRDNRQKQRDAEQKAARDAQAARDEQARQKEAAEKAQAALEEARRRAADALSQAHSDAASIARTTLTQRRSFSDPSPQSTPWANGDASVVDARGLVINGNEMVAQVPELAKSPAADAMAKGFGAMKMHDWPLTLAWWQDALRRDPDNAAIKRSVALAQWTIKYKNELEAAKVPWERLIKGAPYTNDALFYANVRALVEAAPHVYGDAGYNSLLNLMRKEEYRKFLDTERAVDKADESAFDYFLMLQAGGLVDDETLRVFYEATIKSKSPEQRALDDVNHTMPPRREVK